MIKIAHLSDIHAGYTATRHLNNQGINVREADGYVAFARIVTDCINHDVDLVVIAGDTFQEKLGLPVTASMWDVVNTAQQKLQWAHMESLSALTPAEDAALVTIQRAYNDLIRMAQGQ